MSWSMPHPLDRKHCNVVCRRGMALLGCTKKPTRRLFKVDRHAGTSREHASDDKLGLDIAELSGAAIPFRRFAEIRFDALAAGIEFRQSENSTAMISFGGTPQVCLRR